jgi:hypothetical protein
MSLAVVLACGVASSQKDDDLDWTNLKGIWNGLTRAEKDAYREAAREMAREGGRAIALGRTLRPSLLGSADTCAEASPELSALPRLFSDDTSGFGDDYGYGDACGCSPIDPRAPNCGGFNGDSGVGPDIAYKVVVDQDCTLLAQLSPTDPLVDMALYVTTDCDDIASGCVGGDDWGAEGQGEEVPFEAVAGTDYWVVVDGFLGDSGPFELVIVETGSTPCSILPVELLTFGVE